jgi:CBS domain-containing membrane protein
MDDLDAVLEDWDEVLDVSREDLDALFRAVEARVRTRTD